MKKIIQLFAGLFVFMFLFQIVWTDSITTALLMAAAFAVLMSIILGFLHIQSGGHEPVQEELWDVPLSYEAAFIRCKEAGLQLKKAEINEERKREGILKVHTGASLKSWGNEVVFQIQDIDPKTTRVAVTSRPRLKVTFMDYGENYGNMRKIGKVLEKET